MIKKIMFVSLLLAGGASWAAAQTASSASVTAAQSSSPASSEALAQSSCNQQTMTLQRLYNLADQNSQKVKVSEVALQAADEGVAAAKSAMLPSIDLGLQGS